MTIVFPLLLFVLSGGGLIAIIGRKWRQLTILDVENIPAVKEARKKNEILKKKIESLALAAKAKRMIKWWIPVLVRFRGWQQRFRSYVIKVEQRMRVKAERLRRPESPDARRTRSEEARQCVADGAFALARGEAERAEKHFLAAIRLERKNSDAYRGLAEVYERQGHDEEARETYRFLLRLDPRDDVTYAKLADMSERAGNAQEAVEYLQQAVILNDSISGRFAKLAALLMNMGEYQTALESAKQAVELEPQNPKYLDSLVEIAILAADRPVAEAAWQALRMVNPDNQKLPALREKIEQLPG